MAPPKFSILSNAEWLEQRKQVITATESAVLLGLNPWSNPAKMLAEKTEKKFVGNSFTFMGQLLEPIVMQLVNHSLESEFKLVSEGEEKIFYTHPTARIGATPDCDDGIRFLECKTTKPTNYLKYTIEPPLYYVMQLITQLFCAERAEGILAIMSTDLTQHTPTLNLPLLMWEVTYQTRLTDLLTQETERFWLCNEEGVLFKVNSDIKKEAQELLRTSFRRIQ